LHGVETRLTAWRAPKLTAGGPSNERALRFAASLLSAYRLECGAHLEIESVIPEHAGLGSGTQLALAVSAALIRLFGREGELGSLASVTERGARSGIGLGAFEQGGFLVDGGRARHTKVPPIICRQRFPESWRVILIMDGERDGLSGEGERTAFEKLPPMTPEISGYLCRLVLMQILPALVEQNLTGFSRAIAVIQTIVGDYFAEFQGGRYSSPAVAQALDWFRERGVEGVGQSSWGPTGFALVESAVEASKLVREASLSSAKPLCLKVCRGRNEGARVQVNQRARQVG
jgi:beta-ribofuranosylaminobenzene 5'-phosphate synthase